MIDFSETWLPQLVGYADLVADEQVLRRAWLNSDVSETSVTSPDELIEQVLDDLDSEAMVQEASLHLACAPGLAGALGRFVEAMVEWDGGSVSLQSDELLFAEPSWGALRREAEMVLAEVLKVVPNPSRMSDMGPGRK